MIAEFKNTYVKLGKKFYTKTNPIPVKDPKLIDFNYLLASELGVNIQNLSSKEIAEIFSGNKIFVGSEPVALVYAGHQFGQFVPQLGDGRAILLGEVIDKQGSLRDIQLKGSGKTPYSRQGDGRAALGPVIREYIISEAMYALRVKTTRSLAIVTTGEKVLRETLLPGAILTRIAASHIRIGTFEYFKAQNDLDAIRTLADYAIDRHYPKAKEASDSYYTFVEEVMKSQISLIVDWMRVGFIHGVMNTDNMSISGETIDYGPCAFMDHYHPNKVFSSIDDYGRYAFGNQANICIWNIVRLYQSLIPILHIQEKLTEDNIISDLISLFTSTFNQKWLEMMGKKIGIIHSVKEDLELIQELLKTMQEHEMDYTLTFRYLTHIVNYNEWPYGSFFSTPEILKDWMQNWRIRIEKQDIPNEKLYELMAQVNPAFIPRNHIIEKVIKTADIDNDFTEMKKLITVLSNPYNEQKESIMYMRPPLPNEIVSETFCGT